MTLNTIFMMFAKRRKPILKHMTKEKGRDTSIIYVGKPKMKVSFTLPGIGITLRQILQWNNSINLKLLIQIHKEIYIPQVGKI